MRAAYAQQSGGPAPALQGDSCANDKQPVGAGHPQPSASTAELLRQAQQAQQAQPGQGSSSEAWMETFTCPITQELIRDPVIAADGFTYERSSIEKWLQKSDTSPMTNLKLEHRILIPNMMVRAALQNMGLQ
ncbi:hypothetical protein WJX72_001288 [[Myrmecia] bisecta]|uniref:U-box domain-containing protein n=1 Tax=[Myrmecia] bisecta TaxID=41462 RepID=A0AAW1PT34_9CHLO